MNKVLITGITGKSGEAFLDELIKNKDKLNDYSFRFFIRSTSNKEIFKDFPLNFELFEGNLNENKDGISESEYKKWERIIGVATLSGAASITASS